MFGCKILGREDPSISLIGFISWFPLWYTSCPYFPFSSLSVIKPRRENISMHCYRQLPSLSHSQCTHTGCAGKLALLVLGLSALSSSTVKSTSIIRFLASFLPSPDPVGRWLSAGVSTLSQNSALWFFWHGQSVQTQMLSREFNELVARTQTKTWTKNNPATCTYLNLRFDSGSALH